MPREAISAASATVGDLRQFCTRQPDACTVGSHVATELGYKAQAGAKMIYDFLTEALASKDSSKDTSKEAPKVTGSLASVPDKASQNTLTPADLVPAWHAPLPRKDRQAHGLVCSIPARTDPAWMSRHTRRGSPIRRPAP